MGKSRRPPYLRLVVSPPEPPPEPPPERGQLRLFPAEAPTELVIVDMTFITDDEIMALLGEAPPRWLMDLRPLPRFDFGHLNRGRAFRIFSQNGIRYCDLCGTLGIYSRSDASFLSGRVAEEIARFFREARAESSPGKTMVLVDMESLARALMDTLPIQIQPPPLGGWKTSLYRANAARSWVREG